MLDVPQPEEKETFIFDSEIKGFSLRMTLTSEASYIIKYCDSENQQRKITLVHVGTMMPKQAWQMARKKMAEISKGADRIKQVVV